MLPVVPVALQGSLPEAPNSPRDRRSPEFHVEETTIAKIHAALRSGQLTCVQLVQLYLERIQAYNGPAVDMPTGRLGPITTRPDARQLNALCTLNLRPAARKRLGFDQHNSRTLTDTVDDDPHLPDALEVAAHLDRQFAAKGELIGPLHGAVVCIKDQYDTADMRSTSGGDAAFSNDRPPRDATFVSRLREAGAIILAKANLGEYASGIPRSSFGGVFVNAYDTQRSPGVSSAGCGTAVAANLVTCAIGEETGSSVRGPASYNSCVGISPTQELVSRHGMIGAGINTRVGPICRCVEDAARLLSVIAGYDPLDELTAFSVGKLPPHRYEDYASGAAFPTRSMAARSVPPSRMGPRVEAPHSNCGRASLLPLYGVRIGVVREFMDTAVLPTTDHGNISIVDAAIEQLRSLGAVIIEPSDGENGLFSPYIRRLYVHH